MGYNYNKQINYDAANKKATLIINSFFKSSGIAGLHALISTPNFLIIQDKQVTVQLLYYIAPNTYPNGGLQSLSSHMTTLTQALEQVYSTPEQPVVVQLELVRQYHPYMDATILAQYLAINLSKHGFSRVTNLLLNAVPYLNPTAQFNLSCITGVKVQLSGLLTSQRNRSRKSVYTASAGTFHSSSSTYISELVTDYASYTSKSGLGAFTVKV